jgi:hypothetical protein
MTNTQSLLSLIGAQMLASNKGLASNERLARNTVRSGLIPGRLVLGVIAASRLERYENLLSEVKR